MTDYAALTAGPFLLARGADASGARLAAVTATAADDSRPPPPLMPEDGVAVVPEALGTLAGTTLWRYDFALPARRQATYSLAGRSHGVATDLTGPLRVAFVACNGREEGDLDRDPRQRNLLWADLAEELDRAPVHLLLQGGDQVYADDIWQAHPDLDAWERASGKRRAGMPFPDDVKAAAERFYLERCLAVFTMDETAAVMARVPSLMMWDDHDIFDGWGSHDACTLDSPIGRGVFEAARAVFRMVQLGLPMTGPEETLSWHVEVPGLGIVLPDLRSERRPDRVMGAAGWQAFEAALAALADRERLLVVSTVPALGPRLSLLEAVIGWVPHASKYDDDLRDQWQSRAHRDEWRRFLSALIAHSGRGPGVTVLSGEIHLATQGVMACGGGREIRQLVSSGISHPEPPAAWAAFLGLLARLGETPLPEHPIRLMPLPGCRGIYRAERNYLMLDRDAAGTWTARWRLEKTGWTPPLAL